MNESIRVLFHVDSLAVGGLEKKVTRVVLGLDRGRFDPVVSYSSQWGPYGEELRRGGVQVEQIVPCAPGQNGASEAVRQIRELAPQVFHSFSCRRNADDVWAAHQAGTPLIITARGNVRHWATPGPARNWEFDRNAMTHFVSACCDAVAHVACEVEGIHPEKVAVIHNGVDIPETCGASMIREELGIPEGAFLAGYAAKYRVLKAHETLLKAWKKVVAVRPDAFLVCCGDDEKGRREHLQELVCGLELAGNVILLGALQEMDSFYRGLDLYVHASRSEGFSNSILEAMSYGLPIAATAVGGTPEAIQDGISGVLVDSDPRALTEAILKLADAPEARRALGRAAGERVPECFSLSRMVQGYESLYVTALEKRRLRDLPPPAALEFTGSANATALDDVTVFVTTVGDEENFSDCMVHLQAQTVRCRIDVIGTGVTPMSAAFAQMHARCVTPYYVQVDEDMLLYPHALARLHALMTEAEASVPLVCAPLWDCDVERPILGVKIYRHEVVKRFPYQDKMGCEVIQLREMSAAGHHALILSTEEDDAACLGEHGKHYSPRTIFLRWQRLFHRRNEMGNLMWLDPWPGRLLERYMKTRDHVHLYAALGAIAGIAGRGDGDRELDWRETNPAWHRLQHYVLAEGQE